jgi:tetratricopeptide (TPR) repeat protein
VSFFGRLSAKKRVRAAARALGNDASAENYVSLAREYIVLGQTREVLRVCEEGLAAYPAHPELERLTQRARQLYQEDRLHELSAELDAAPRPALYREYCELLLEGGRVQRALEAAERWRAQTDDPEALYFLAAAHAELYFDGRRSADGLEAYELAARAARDLPQDRRAPRLQFEIARRCGAWEEARRALARLLELMPGNPALESRFRSVLANCAQAKPLARALHEVEKSGQFVDDLPEDTAHAAPDDIRALLKDLASDPSVRAAVYLRGGTGLVQGAQGPTAERTARAIREVLQGSRSAARRMALGRPLRIEAEGSFGSLLVSPGDLGNVGVWTKDTVPHATRLRVAELSGSDAPGGVR